MRCIDFQLLDCWFNNWRNLIWTAYFRRLRCGQLPTYLTLELPSRIAEVKGY